MQKKTPPAGLLQVGKAKLSCAQLASGLATLWITTREK